MENILKRNILYVLLCLGIGVLLMVSSNIVVFLLIGVGFLMFALEFIKLLPWIVDRNNFSCSWNTEKPMVSVHLAICNEPPEMVIRTIRGILKQDYGHFEIIVVDNNTKDENLWKPIESFCRRFGNIRFFHLHHWPFYKSGALNFARKVTSKNAEHIFVIDADYYLEKGALSMAVKNVVGRSIALVQFPQAYSVDNLSLTPILKEFDHFFNFYCLKADSCYGALATGTLSLIRLEALDEIGGWPTSSITEDAELGSRLQSAGHDIKYVHRIIGRGVIPISQYDFIKQRKRWIFGNVQTLLRYSTNPIRNFRKWSSGISQLTAWINLMGIPILCIATCVLFYPLIEMKVFLMTVQISYIAYWIFVLSKIFQYTISEKGTMGDSASTFLISLSTLGIGAFHWWPVLCGNEQAFERTDKSNRQSDYRANLFYPLLNFLATMAGIVYGSPFIMASGFIFFCLHLAAVWRDCSLRTTKGSNIIYDVKLHL